MDVLEEQIKGYLKSQYPKEVILKDGSGVTIRPALEEERDSILRLYSRLPEMERWFVDMDETFSYFERPLQRGNKISLVAELENRIIAHGMLVKLEPECVSHIGRVRIIVDPALRGKNLATWLLLDINNLAMELNIEILVMNLAIATRIPISRGIEKLGFKEVALIKDYLRDMDGKPHDLSIMLKRINISHSD